ncbi:RdgB/HAM1 family non-canonical purine NTP pyrophosphatase [Gloeobacter morelensis]|uniref:dITP/XTP pyrophosphatase n=1 Tax=Gloeobacter morelensis MG652769 TaxID=2781736 RepID=A0ABY3PIC1_9CYAN|nr:RdgB/HAM1 family non-canonical purine NTP pyrophosphatase [Gloeobacter morelensis MG652769]
MMRSLILATNNQGKLQELRRLLAGTGWVVQAAPSDFAVEETGTTFAENARLKALAAAERTGEWSVGDDSGLAVDALGGAPGVYSARYGRNDGERISRLLAALAGQADRGARFICAIALAEPGRVLKEVEAECRGVILHAPRGNGGFGYDPIFLVPELDKTFAELDIVEKERHSHRGRAVRKLLSGCGRGASIVDH